MLSTLPFILSLLINAWWDTVVPFCWSPPTPQMESRFPQGQAWVGKGIHTSLHSLCDGKEKSICLTSLRSSEESKHPSKRLFAFFAGPSAQIWACVNHRASELLPSRKHTAQSHSANQTMSRKGGLMWLYQTVVHWMMDSWRLFPQLASLLTELGTLQSRARASDRLTKGTEEEPQEYEAKLQTIFC